MLRKFSILITWKDQTWKNYKFYSTYLLNPHFSSSHIVSLNISITKNARKGELKLARQIFEEMPLRTVVSYNTLITGYSKWGLLEEALSVASIMHRDDMKPNEMTFSSLLSVCSRLRSLCDGKLTHCLVLKSGAENFEFVGSSLLNFYASCKKIAEARRVFDVLHEKNELLWSLMLVGYVHCNLMTNALEVFLEMPVRDVIAWTTLISGYSRNEHECKKALEMFRFMRVCGEVKPNEFTFDSVLRATSKLGALKEGKVVHGLGTVFGYELDHSIGGALIELYCSCGVIEEAKNAYKKLRNPSLNSSNSLIGGLLSYGKIEEAEMVFNQLKERNSVSYNLMIKGYSISGRVKDSKRLFEEMPERTSITSNTMISVYCRNGELDEALKLFEQTKWERNTVTWNSMISGYILNNQPEKAIKLYVTMQRIPIEPNRSTFSGLCHACSCIGSLQQGRLLHGHVLKMSFESNIYVGTALVDMYAKCGNITDAKNSFADIPTPNVAAWTSLINGYAHHGLGTEAISLFYKMLEQGVHPNAVTFVGIILACGRVGFVNEGMKFFSSMESYGVTPTLEHYACVVDLLGRSGLVQEALELIKNMPIKADTIIWGTLLKACWFWMKLEIGEKVAEKMLTLDPKQISSYVIMSNIYARVGKWEEVVKVRKRLRGLEVKKDPGCSWIEVNNTVHVFCVEDRTHPYCNEVYAILEDLMPNIEYNVGFNYVVFDYENCEMVL